MAQSYTKTLWKDHVVDATKGEVLQQGTPVSASNLNHMEEGIDLAHQKLEGANRQVQSIGHGIQILNADVSAPPTIQIDGRTLISLLNTELDASKFYVLTDKKTKLKFSDTLTVQGVSKFPGVNAKPQAITRIANFENKATGSIWDNPHIAKRTAGGQAGSTTLLTPSTIPNELEQVSYTSIATIGGTTQILSGENVGSIAQLVYSFNIIEEIERNIGKIPRNTLTEKIAWAKANIARITWIWVGNGSGPSGNKATVNLWYADSGKWSEDAWGQKKSNTTSAVSAITNFQLDSEIPKIIDSSGFYHLIAYADAASASVPSTVYADYVELQIELKSTATLFAPKVPLYEVTKEHYDAVLVTWNEAEVLRRYPMVEGIQHIQNPYILAESDNLLAPFGEWNLASTGGTPYVNVVDDYTLEVLPTVAMTVATDYDIAVKGGQTYIFNLGSDSIDAGVRIFKGDLSNSYIPSGKYTAPLSFTTDANETRVRVRVFNSSGAANAKAVISKPMLTPGSIVKTFAPKNPSYLFAEAKLGAIDSFKDTLYEQDGKLWVKKYVDKDVSLDGLSVSWGPSPESYVGYKRLKPDTSKLTVKSPAKKIVTKYNGKVLVDKGNDAGTMLNGDEYMRYGGDNSLAITVLNTDSGWSDSYSPTIRETTAYFNGWKAKTTDANGKPTAWVSLVDGSDAPTQTEQYVYTNIAPGYIPYKINSVLQTPVITEVKFEGAISVAGLTQLEVGSGVVIREKVNAMHVSGVDGNSYINASFGTQNTWLKNPTLTILAVYKGGSLDKGWNFGGTLANTRGKVYASKKTVDIDSAADYYISYVVFDRSQLTNNVLSATATFASNIRTALDDNIKATEDNKREISINALQIYNMLVRLKAGGL